MIDFARLTTAAVVGTGTAPVDRADVPDALAGALGQGGDAAGLLLDTAAAWAAVRRASLPAGPAAPPLELPAPRYRTAPAEVVSLLHRLRATAVSLRERLQHEALQALAARGLTVPHDLLLPLLGEASTRPELARDVAALLDARGWALVALDPVWSAGLARAGAARVDDPGVWSDGTDAQRVAHLAAVRSRDPDAGRALLEDGGFAAEPPDLRDLLVRQLRTGLAPADEPFLEDRLDDRAPAVRRSAAALLAVLPGSAYARRAEALAAAHVRRSRRALRPAVTEVEAVPVTAATLRDGYPDRDAAGTPPGLLHLREVLALVDPRRWPTLVGAGAAELATGAARLGGAAVDLREPFVAAAVRWGDADLAEALVRDDPATLVRLVGVLGTDARERALLAALDGPPHADLLAAALRPPVTARVCVAAADALRRLATARDQVHRAAGLLPTLALHSDPLAAPAVIDRLRAWEAAVGDAAPGLRRELAAAVTALQLRQALAEALLPCPIVDPSREEG